MFTQRSIGLAVLAGVAVVAASVPAAAAPLRTWNSVTNTLKVYEGGVIQGEGYGNWQASTGGDGTRSRTGGTIRDRRAGGDSIFYETQTWVNAGNCFAPDYTSCSANWYYHASKQSTRMSAAAWTTYRVTTGLRPAADHARAVVKVCEDQRFQPDPCSGVTYTKGNQY